MSSRKLQRLRVLIHGLLMFWSALMVLVMLLYIGSPAH